MSNKCPACHSERNFSFARECDDCSCPLNANPTKDEIKIFKEVAKRRKRATDLGLPEMISKLYSDKIEFYPSWITIEANREHVCSLVTSAEKIKAAGQDEKDKIKIILKGREYSFEYSKDHFSLPDGDSSSTGDLILYFGNKKVFHVSMSIDFNEYGSTMSNFKPEAFVEGDWVKDFQELSQRIPIEEKERETREAEKEMPESVKKLKEDFGIG